VPETVVGRFLLVPVQGSDPVRAPRRGQVSAVRVAEGDVVARGAPLFVVRSDPVGDLSAELNALRRQLRGLDDAERNAREQYEGRRRADVQNRAMLEAQLASLDQTIVSKREQRTLAARLATTFRTGRDHGSVSDDEYTSRELEVARFADEQARAESDRTQTAGAIARLRHEVDARDAEYRETARRLAEDRERAQIRAAALERELAHTTGDEQLIVAPCAGTVLRLRVRAPGAVVQEGESVTEMDCTHQGLQAELAVPQSGVGRLHAGQAVRLLYDAFPYQRFGVRRGRVRWVSPASTAAVPSASDAGADEPAFRALVDLDDAAIAVDGRSRPLLPGMAGQARVVVSRRTLVSYAFEPIRQLRESFGGGDE
jgi:membrane fusion protein